MRYVPKEDLERRYRNEKNPRVKERLLAIILLYDGKKVYELPSLIKRCKATIESWISRWNRQGYDGLMPNFTGGPKPKLPDGEWDKMVKEIEGKGMTMKDVTVYVKNTRGVEYSYKTVWKILRKEKGVRYGKPYIRNKLRPDGAEGILKKDR